MAILPSLAPAPSSANRPLVANTPSRARYISLLHKSSCTQDLAQIHTHLLKSNLIRDPFVSTKLLSIYAIFDDLHSSLMLFASLQEDPFSLPPLLKACGKISAGFVGTQIHCHAVKRGFVRDVYVSNSLMQMYFKCGRYQNARKLFDKMSQRNVVSWNCVIGGYAELGLSEDVICLFQAMVGENSVKPNAGSLARVVTACSRLEDVEAGKWVLRYLVENGVAVCLNLGNALINMHAKFGDMEEAQRLFDEMDEHDVVSWTTLVSGYASVGYLELARKFFDEMPVRNSVAWNSMIAGYVHNGCFEEAILLYEKMLVWNILLIMHMQV